MSNNFVTLILKTVIDISQLLGFEYFASLVLEHSIPDSRLYGQTLFSSHKKAHIFQCRPLSHIVYYEVSSNRTMV